MSSHIRKSDNSVDVWTDIHDPLVTVVVCTKDRGDSISGTLRTLLLSDYAKFELFVIDQSKSDDTQLAVKPFLSDQRVSYVRSPEVGVSRSRNLGLGIAHSEYVLMTDDDCEVRPNWIRANLDALSGSASPAIVFGDVVAPPDLRPLGTIPESIADHDFIVTRMSEMKFLDGASCGIGASMAMRRSVILSVGGFDELLGPGAKLRTAEDTDLTLRVLLSGHSIARTRTVRVDHFGVRSSDEFRVLMRSTMFGLGAVCGKLARWKPAKMTYFSTRLTVNLILAPAFRSITRFNRPPVLGRVVYFVRGIRAGLSHEVDDQTHLFVNTDAR